MKKLSLEKIDFQKQQLVLKDSNKDSYYVPVNDEIKNAIYKIEAEQNKIQKTNLSPKEIQRKIRAGFTPEQITQWTDLTLEDINRFAAPIEGEKIIAIKDLQNLKLDKEKPFESIFSIVSRVLGKKNASANDIQWNAIKIDENPWQIEASYHDQNFEFDAKFLFDSTKKLVEPLNQDANFLLDLEPDLEISRSESVDNDSKIVSFDDQIKDEYESHNYTQNNNIGATISPNLATAQILAIKPDSSASAEVIESNTPKVSKDAASKDNAPNNSDKSTIIYRPEKEKEVKVNVEIKKEKSEEAPDRTTVIVPEVVAEPQLDKTEVAKSVEKTVVENKSETKIEPEKSASEAKSDTKPETKVEPEKSPSKSQRMKVPSWDDIMLGGSETQA